MHGCLKIWDDPPELRAPSSPTRGHLAHGRVKILDFLPFGGSRKSMAQSKPAAKAPGTFFTLDGLRSEAPKKAYQEFLRVPSMSLGVYRLRKGAKDPQSPHREDEVYVVIQGQATMEVDGRRLDMAPGAILFVPAGADHRFIDIQEDLEVLVFFAPAESLPGA